MPGTDTGTHARRFISGSPVLAAGQIGLIWTEGNGPFDVFTTALGDGAGRRPPAIVLVAPADGSTVFGAVPISATASDDRGVGGVQFKVDSLALGPPQPAPPYQISWDSGEPSPTGRIRSRRRRPTAPETASSAFASVSVSNRPVISRRGRLLDHAIIGGDCLDDRRERHQPRGLWRDGGVRPAVDSDGTLVERSPRSRCTALAGSTTYHYQVTSADAAGNPASAGDFTFTTPADDPTPPTVSMTAPG